MQSDTVDDVIGRALAEDLGAGDVTTEAIGPRDLEVTADVVVKAAGVICGTAELLACVRLLDPDAEIDVRIGRRRRWSRRRRRSWPGSAPRRGPS